MSNRIMKQCERINYNMVPEQRLRSNKDLRSLREEYISRSTLEAAMLREKEERFVFRKAEDAEAIADLQRCLHPRLEIEVDHSNSLSHLKILS